MNDVICRQAAIDELNRADDMGTIRSILDVLDVLRTLPSAQPTADVRPNKKARLTVKTEGLTHYYICDQCGASIDPDDNYCRRCGAEIGG